MGPGLRCWRVCWLRDSFLRCMNGLANLSSNGALICRVAHYRTAELQPSQHTPSHIELLSALSDPSLAPALETSTLSRHLQRPWFVVNWAERRNHEAKKIPFRASAPCKYRSDRTFVQTADRALQKIGSLKGESKASSKEIPIGFDSPPVTPKSVRPPLSPGTDYALRTACALVLQEYKPSTQTYEEQYGDLEDASPQLQYGNIDISVEREAEVPLQPLNTINTQTASKPARWEERVNARVVSQELKQGIETTMEGNLNSERFVDRQKELEEYTEQLLRAERPEPKSIIPKPAHKRSNSNPVLLSNGTLKIDGTERPRTAPRSNSTRTNGSTPPTDGTDYGWTGSTAPTTAAMTPARTSKRASHVQQSGSASSSVPKFPTMDGEWMRQDFEKHRKALEEARAQQELEDQVVASVMGDSTIEFPSSPAVRPLAQVTRVPPRKPVPRRSTSTRQSNVAHERADSRPSTELRRSGSRKRRSTPRSESQHELGLLRPESRQSKDDSKPFTQTHETPLEPVKHFYPTPVPPAPMPSKNVSRDQSRSRSITRQIRDYVRSGSRNHSRNVSNDISRPQSRSRSIDSFRSTVSSLAPSFDSATNRWRSWRPFHRNQDSMESADISRPGSSNATTKGRGREAQQSSPQQKSKPPINLNRELPPLPSLDQWKPDEPEQPKPKHVASMMRNSNANGTETRDDVATQIASPTRSRSQKRSGDTTASSQRPRDSVLTNTSNHPKRISSLGAPCHPSQYPIPNTNSLSLPTSPGLSTEPKKERRRSRSIEVEFPPELREKMRNATGGQVETETPARTPSKGHVVNYSRTSGGPINGNIGRKPSQNNRATTMTGDSVASIQRQPSMTSEQKLNFSRKISSDDYIRMYDRRYQNVVEIKSPASPGAGAKPLPTTPKTKDKTKKKWWQPASKQKREKTWMDDVVKSGSRSGLILTDGIADAPIARY